MIDQILRSFAAKYLREILNLIPNFATVRNVSLFGTIETHGKKIIIVIERKTELMKN